MARLSVVMPSTPSRTRRLRSGPSLTVHARALAQTGGVALGAQAGPAAVGQLAEDAGFSRFRQVTQTPVSIVLELGP
jgi:hypothetical protein